MKKIMLFLAITISLSVGVNSWGQYTMVRVLPQIEVKRGITEKTGRPTKGVCFVSESNHIQARYSYIVSATSRHNIIMSVEFSGIDGFLRYVDTLFNSAVVNTHLEREKVDVSDYKVREMALDTMRINDSTVILCGIPVFYGEEFVGMLQGRLEDGRIRAANKVFYVYNKRHYARIMQEREALRKERRQCLRQRQAQEDEVRVEEDDFRQTRTVSCRERMVDNVGIYKTHTKYTVHRKMYFYYSGPRWKFLHTIVFLIDGKRVAVEDEHPYHSVAYGRVYETLEVTITSELYSALKYGKDVRIKALGSRDDEVFTWSERQTKRMVKVLSYEVESE